jgi:hypothetical protein
LELTHEPELKREIYRAIERGGHEPAYEISRLVIGCLRDVPPDAVTFFGISRNSRPKE